MKNITETYSPTNNFWEYNPQFTAIQPFRKLWKADRTINKNGSSDLMWAIALIYHPKSDLYYVTGKEEKISDTVLGLKKNEVEDFWKGKQDLIDAFIDTVLTQAERSLADWCDYMKKRDAYLKNTRYYFDEYKTDDDGNNVYSKTGQEILLKGTAEQLDKAWGASKSMWADYDKVSKAILNDDMIDDGSSNKKQKSPTATGDI